MVVVQVTVHPQGLSPAEAAKAWYSYDFLSEDAVTYEWTFEWDGGGAFIMKRNVHEEGAEDEMGRDPRESKKPARENAWK